MPIFEHFAEEIRDIESEIVRRGIVLGIDWEDELAVRSLAREALTYHPDNDAKVSHTPSGALHDDTAVWRAKLELFGLAQLMLKVMAESAEENLETHGGPVWKAFGRALWLESGLAD